MSRLLQSILPAGVALAFSAWGALTALYSPMLQGVPRMVAAATVATLGLWFVVSVLRRRRTVLPLTLLALALGAVALGWSRIEPSNTRDWQADVAVLASATIDGNLVTVRNIRNFIYRSATDVTPRYYERTFDVRKLTGVDLFAVYWMGPAVAHIFVSFEFEGGEHLAISIETRKERGEAYSPVLGFFRQYELYYVVADERDVVRLRTEFRAPPEDVFMYRLQAPVENGRRLFLEYMKRLNALASTPQFYNTLEDNCTTGAWFNTHVNPGRPPFSWKLLASGYTPEYLHEIGRLDRSLPFAELKARALINDRVRAAGDSEDFSRRIRVHGRS